VLIGLLRKRLSRRGREVFGGWVIGGEWTMLDARDRGIQE